MDLTESYITAVRILSQYRIRPYGNRVFLFPSNFHHILCMPFNTVHWHNTHYGQLESLWAACLFSSVEFFSLTPLRHCKEYVSFWQSALSALWVVNVTNFAAFYQFKPKYTSVHT